MYKWTKMIPYNPEAVLGKIPLVSKSKPKRFLAKDKPQKQQKVADL
jgi:hypothetical protein